MIKVLRLEELGMFLLSIYLISQLPYAWYWWLVWILAPIAIYLAGFYTGHPAMEYAG